MFGYVLEGEYEHAVNDYPVTIYKAGDTFYEPTGLRPSSDEESEQDGDDASPRGDPAPRDANDVTVPEKEKK